MFALYWCRILNFRIYCKYICYYVRSSLFQNMHTSFGPHIMSNVIEIWGSILVKKIIETKKGVTSNLNHPPLATGLHLHNILNKHRMARTACIWTHTVEFPWDCCSVKKYVMYYNNAGFMLFLWGLEGKTVCNILLCVDTEVMIIHYRPSLNKFLQYMDTKIELNTKNYSMGTCMAWWTIQYNLPVVLFGHNRF